MKAAFAVKMGTVRSPRRPTRLHIATLLIWLAVLALIVYVLRTVALADVLVVLARLRGWQIVVLLLGNALMLLLFAGRWWVILRAQGWRIPFLLLASYRLAAFGISYFTPGSQFGGEPLQVYLAHRKHAVPIPAATASVALEKLVELVVNFSFLAMGIAATLQSPLFAGRATTSAFGISLALLALPLGFLGAVWVGRHPVSSILALLPAAIQRSERVARIRAGIAAAESDAARLCRERPAALIEALIMSLLSWVAMVAEVWLTVYFLGTALTLTELITVMTASRVAILMPVPGGLGTLEASQVWIFRALGHDPALGLALSLVIHARDVLFALLGLWWGTVAATSAAHSHPSPE